MKPFEQFPENTRRNIRFVLTDIDDTLTLEGRLPSTVFGAMERLRKADISVIPITGRPAGWCDHIARMWPVDGVVGENGALYFWFDEKERKLKKRFFDPEDVRADKRQRLKLIAEEILTSIPGTATASDQRYRETDLAIDYCEDVTPLDRKAVERVCEIFKKHGATCKVSSIHVNGWFGNYDKLKMTEIFVQEQWGLDLNENKEQFLFCGDSPNDEPMFKYFPSSVGVKNVINFADRMTHLPAFVTNNEGGAGFAEMVDTLLS
ncbi:MAG: HAD-IIB family hydrolase [Desulfobacteraceae bacterium]|nr:MAG: HAD-IIB family hydrolase [Desulfobacteraceae bacterium]